MHEPSFINLQERAAEGEFSRIYHNDQGSLMVTCWFGNNIAQGRWCHEVTSFAKCWIFGEVRGRKIFWDARRASLREVRVGAKGGTDGTPKRLSRAVSS